MFTPSSAYETGKGRERKLERRIKERQLVAEAAEGQTKSGNGLLSTLARVLTAFTGKTRSAAEAVRMREPLRE